VLDTLAAAREQEQAARASLAAARRWHRALELLSRELSVLERELAGNLAPQLTAELAAVLERAPVARVKRVGLSSQLELLLDVADAPPGLAGAELMERLSLGARRQLALALRVAVGRALGEARAVPLLLDEPLAELDDEHALASLRYLGTLAAEQQVILMTCHARHYDWLRRESGVAAHVVSLP
jgi:ABC-type transport system involved in cytochrome bd biosynthesis fused ATPase/permease subunit